MCGIAGFIGKSKNPDISFKLISRLFQKIESRGKDASGFWCVSDSGSIFFHKEPIKSSDFIQKQEWQNLSLKNPSIIICHAREASKGVGSPDKNENNHPFVSDDLSIAAIHNGRIPDEVYFELKKNYNLKSECDSELFLKMFESDIEIENTIEDRIYSIREIWYKLFGSHMAVIIAEQTFESSRLWIFRNEHRSLFMFDATNLLGQIFFVSTQEIWEEATNFLFPYFYAEEIKTEKIYLFELDTKIKTSTYPIL